MGILKKVKHKNGLFLNGKKDKLLNKTVEMVFVLVVRIQCIMEYKNKIRGAASYTAILKKIKNN
jgi:hypothetical protein